eukprot:12882636-Prorocentrum_lima.AAC.1
MARDMLICTCQDVRRALIHWSLLQVDVFLSHGTDAPYHHAIQYMKTSSTTNTVFWFAVSGWK